jgi:YhgE/Pip-like protein
MVAEIQQYFEENVRLKNLEADCLYAGIIIDTNNFVAKTGARTFEAAAYLRRMGADTTDVKLLLRNPIALLVVGALLVLPGLYAWYCIIANWDPYANTGNMPIAVVNEDAGANSELTGEINIGKQVIDQLKENDSIDWHFYDSEEKALLDTRDGTCYAAIVFPETLSQDVIGIFSGSAAEPTLY